MDNQQVVIRVISMVGSSRRDRMREQLDKASIDWSFFDGRHDAPEDIPYIPANARKRHGRELMPGELGCFASHRALWREATELGPKQVMLVLEDDLVLDPVFFSSIQKAADAALPFGYLRLYAKVPAGLRLEARFLNRFVARFSGRAYGTQAYFISASTACRFLRSIRSVVRPVDDEMDRFWAHKIPIRSVFPSPVMEVDYGSSIDSARRESGNIILSERIALMGTKATEKMRRHLASIT